MLKALDMGLGDGLCGICIPPHGWEGKTNCYEGGSKGIGDCTGIGKAIGVLILSMFIRSTEEGPQLEEWCDPEGWSSLIGKLDTSVVLQLPHLDGSSESTEETGFSKALFLSYIALSAWRVKEEREEQDWNEC
jgi:hypothetical protein